MAELSVYYVPERHLEFADRGREVAEEFWKIGVFLVTEDRFIYERIREWQQAGAELPGWKHEFTFAEMGIGGSPEWDPVPNALDSLRCPNCNGDLTDVAHEVWFDEESPTILPDRRILCPSCRSQIRSSEVRADQPFTFARFYIWISDIDEDDWEPEFQRTVESVLGPCREFKVWET